MSRDAKTGVAIVATAAVASAAVVAGPAPAETTSAGKFRYVQRYFSVPAESESKREVARCPRRTHVYGGGTSAAQSFGRGVVNSSYPVDLGDRDRIPDDGWAVHYDNYMPRADSAIITAICGRANPKYRKANTQIPAYRSRTLSAQCPRGTYAWGGGASTRGPYNTFHLSQTFPSSARAWRSTLANFKGTSRGGSVYVICGIRKPRYVRDSTSAIDQGSTLWDADCPNQSFHLISGGASHSAPGFIGLGTLNPGDGDGTTDAAPDDEMTASFHNYTNSSHRATVHAVCLR